MLGERESFLKPGDGRIVSVLLPSAYSGFVGCQEDSIFFSLILIRECPSVSADVLMDVHLHGPQGTKGQAGSNRHNPGQAATTCVWRCIHSKHLRRVQLRKASSQKESFHSFQQALNLTLKEGRNPCNPNPQPYTSCFGSPSMSMNASQPSAFKSRQCCLQLVAVIYIGYRLPVLLTTEFLFPKTITLLVEKVDLSTSCLKLFVYQNGFCTTCASASTKNRADLLKPERMHSSLYGFMS